jgi:hypothetical protein
MPIRPFLHLPPPGTFSKFSDVQSYLRRLWDALYKLRQGKTENVLEVTLTPNASSTTVRDPRISPQSVLAWHATTANAAAELVSGSMFVADAGMGDGTAIVSHRNNSQTDRAFRVAIIG